VCYFFFFNECATFGEGLHMHVGTYMLFNSGVDKIAMIFCRFRSIVRSMYSYHTCEPNRYDWCTRNVLDV
jgi:hypothetical protein